MTIGIGENICSGSSVPTHEGRLALAATSRWLSRISGELPTMVRPPPMMIAADTGISSRERLTPVRAERRETIGRYSGVTEVFWKNEALRPVTAEDSSSSRWTTPYERSRRNQDRRKRKRGGKVKRADVSDRTECRRRL